MPRIDGYSSIYSYDWTAVIPAGQTTSQAIDLVGSSLCGLFMPAAFTGAAIKIQAATGLQGSFLNVQDGAGSDLSLAVAAGKFVPVANLSLVAGLRFIRLVSGSVEAADRGIVLATRPI